MNEQQEKQYREESIVEFEKYMLDTESELTDMHREYLLKVADLCKTLKTNFKFEVNVVAGVSYMKGYLTACDKIRELNND